MGTFTITSSNLQDGYNYKDSAVIVTGSYNKDATTNTLQNVSGQVYRQNAQGEQGDYIGNFNGYMRDGEIRYSMSEMSRRDFNLVWDAIEGIEPYITGQNANSEE
jgi:hypothetical protein